MKNKSLFYMIIVTHFSLCAWAADLDIKALEAKANQGDAQSAYSIAEHYENSGDPEKALAWYKKASTLALGRSSKALESSLVKGRVERIEKTHDICLYTSIVHSDH